MFTRKDLKNLAALMLQDDFYVSLFLNVEPKDNPKDKWLLHFKNLVKETHKNVTPEVKSRIKSDLEKIERYLSDRPAGMKRGLAIISCQAKNFWRVYHTAIPFSNQLIVEHDPYVKPLMSMIDLYQRYMITIVGGRRARFLLAGLGQVQEISAIDKRPKDSDPSRDGSTGDMGSNRADKQRDEIQRQLYKEVKAKLKKLTKEENIERILLGGTDVNRGKFKDLLSPKMAEDIVGEFTVETGAGDAEILQRALPIMKDTEYRFERKALDELFDMGGSGSVLGLSDVLTALQQGNVRKLFVMSDTVTPGKVCNQCGALTPERDRSCPYCNGEMKRVNHMLDLAIQKAIEQDARIDMLEEAPRLVKAGGIGAKLRY